MWPWRGEGGGGGIMSFQGREGGVEKYQPARRSQLIHAERQKKEEKERNKQKKRRSPSTLRTAPSWITSKVERPQGVSAPFPSPNQPHKIFEYEERGVFIENVDLTVHFLSFPARSKLRERCQDSCRQKGLMTLLSSQGRLRMETKARVVLIWTWLWVLRPPLSSSNNGRLHYQLRTGESGRFPFLSSFPPARHSKYLAWQLQTFHPSPPPSLYPPRPALQHHCHSLFIY